MKPLRTIFAAVTAACLLALAGPPALAQSVYVSVEVDPIHADGPGSSLSSPAEVTLADGGVLILRQDPRTGAADTPFAIPVRQIVSASPASWIGKKEDGEEKRFYTTRLTFGSGNRVLYVAEEWHELVPRLIEAGWGAELEEPLERYIHPADREASE